jgi:hypothetical protein
MLINEDDCSDEDLICRESDTFDDGHTREEVIRSFCCTIKYKND